MKSFITCSQNFIMVSRPMGMKCVGYVVHMRRSEIHGNFNRWTWRNL